MDIDSLERLARVGRELGYEGKDLQDFLRDEHATFREELERKREKEEMEKQLAKEESLCQFELEMAKLKVEESKNTSTLSETSFFHSAGLKSAKLPHFDDSKDSIDAYLTRFEKYNEVMGSDRNNWAIYLAALLKGKALEVYSRLSSAESNDYEALKSALLRRYQLTEEGL